MSRADRPYGRFPRPGEGAEPRPVASAPAARPRWSLRRKAVGALGVVILAALLVLFTATAPAARIAAPAATPAPSPSVQDIYGLVAPSVVSIRAVAPVGERAGSGVVVDEGGTILTALHVVEGTDSLRVTFADGTQSSARVVSEVAASDIAVLVPDAPPPGLLPAVLGDPGGLRIGDGAYVIGDPLGLARSYTVGVIGGLERSARFEGLPHPLQRLIQFDAAVDPGSSGGPLINGRGEVVGIVTGLLAPEGAKGFAGLGFAVRIDVAGGALGQPVD